MFERRSFFVLGVVGLVACRDPAAAPPAGTDGSDTGTNATTNADDTADATGDAVVAIDVTPGCDPLVPSVCAYPFPSMLHVQADPDTVTGFRVAMPAEALPPNALDPTLMIDWLAESDGWPRATTFTAVFPEQALDRSNFPTPYTLADSLLPTSPVQVFDLQTGERLPVWVEIERRGASPAEQALIVRPMVGLPFATRVAVVITDALRHADGSVPVSSPAFAALRDGQITDAEVVESRREDFEAMFETVAAAGVPRESIVLAWQTVVTSEAAAQYPLPQVIDAAAAAVAASPPSYTIDSCMSDEQADADAFGCQLPPGLDPRTWRRVFGTVALPNFIGPDGRIVVTDGEAQIDGTFTAEFVVNIPQSLKTAAPGTGMIVNFGHGLLSDPAYYLSDDGNLNGQIDLADRLGAVFIGTRWSGLSSDDLGVASGLVDDFSGAAAFHDLLVQGMANQVLMIPFVTEVLAADPLLATTDGMASLVDPSNVGYTGISQGGIFGTTLLAVSPFVTNGVLHVPTAGYAHALPHSAEFDIFQQLLDGAIPDLHDQQVFFAVGQRLFDGGDPINFVQNVVASPITPLGPKNALWQCAVGDTNAPWFGCHMLMRTGGFPQLGPPVTEIYGIETIDSPSPAGSSGLAYYDPQLGDPELRTDAPQNVGAHQSIRRNEEVLLQTVDFFNPAAPGTMVNHCDGPCVVESTPTG